MELSYFLKKRAKMLGLSVTTLSKISGVSRSTWHRLINADIKQPRVKTLLCLSCALQVNYAELFLLCSNKKRIMGGRLAVTRRQDACSFIRDVTHPSNAMVKQHEVFEKSWEIINLGGHCWENRRLVCVDDTLDIQVKKQDHSFESNRNNGRLVPLDDSIEVPSTASGEYAILSVKFRTPKQSGPAISFWKMIDAEGQDCFSHKTKLSCLVRVVK
jgi:transcriptional regulator with XRE-family HTH domain